MFLRSLCGYNSHCSPINTPNYLSFDKRVHTTYPQSNKKHILPTTPCYFFDRQHHFLHIYSFLDNQLKSHANELGIRINSDDTTQHAHPSTRITVLKHNHTRTPNLIIDTVLSLSLYVFHLCDVDQTIITIVLHDLLHTRNPPPTPLTYHPSTRSLTRDPLYLS